MLVVLVIAGLLTGLASLSLSRNPRSELLEEGRHLALMLESAADEAQVLSRPVQWRPVPGGYRFFVRLGDAWQPLSDELLRPQQWKTGVQSVIIHYAGADHDSPALEFGTESVDTPVDVTLISADGRVNIVGTGNGRYEAR